VRAAFFRSFQLICFHFKTRRYMNSSTLLETQNLTLDLGSKRILDQLSLEIWPGHVHAIIGPNGAGKSTLASAIMGLSGYTGYSGDILFEGRSLKNLSVDRRARKGITLAWQEPARFEGLPVDTFIRAGAKEKSGETVDRVLRQVGLNPALYASRAVDRTLSGGERKRIELASILAMSPKLVIMDEPDSGIDVEALNRIFEAIRFLREGGSTVILITHSLAVLKQADHAFLICCGRLLEKGSVEKIQSFFGDRCLPCNHKNQPTPEEMHE
jgi:Fe-S cluster assembly ATP-binding protein